MLFNHEKKNQKLRDIDIECISNKDSTYLEVNNGDLNLMSMTEGSIIKATKNSSQLSASIDKMYERRDINIKEIKNAIPDLFLQITSGKNNLLNGLLDANNIDYSSFNAIIVNSSEIPLKLSFEMPDFKTSSLQLTNTSLFAEMDSSFVFDVITYKEGKEKIDQMDVKVVGDIRNNHVNLSLKQTDGNDNVGFDFGLNASLINDTVSLSFDTIAPVIFYIPWKINTGNYVDYSFNNRIKADLVMDAPDGLQIYINSNDSTDIPGKISLFAGVRNFDIAKFTEPFADLPRFKGMLNVDVFAEALKDSINANMNIDITDFVYDKKSLLPLNINGKFFSSKGKGYNIESKILYDLKEITDLAATIKEDNKLTDGLKLISFPAEIANPFIPQDMAALSGYLNGNMFIDGNISAPQINGEVTFEETKVSIGYAEADFNLGNNKITFDKIGRAHV